MSSMAYSQTDLLHEYLWKNRVVILFAPTATNPLYTAQQQMIADHRAGFKERNLVVLTALSDDQSAQPLRSKFSVTDAQFTFVLIGKDGSEKLRESAVVTAKDLFGLIDGMPMRQREIRQQRN